MKIRIKIVKNRPDKNSRFGRLPDQGVEGIIGGPPSHCVCPNISKDSKFRGVQL